MYINDLKIDRQIRITVKSKCLSSRDEGVASRNHGKSNYSNRELGY